MSLKTDTTAPLAVDRCPCPRAPRRAGTNEVALNDGTDISAPTVAREVNPTRAEPPAADQIITQLRSSRIASGRMQVCAAVRVALREGRRWG